jgi:WD40 repeat protein
MTAAVGQLRLRGRIDLADYPVDAAWSPDGKSVIVAGGGGALTLVRIDPALDARPVGEHAGGVLAVTWQKAGNLIASSGQDGTVRLWDAGTFDPRTVHAGKEWSEHLSFSDNGRLLAVATGRTLRVFDGSGELRATLASHSGVIAALAWRPRTAEIAAVGNGGMRLHNLEPQPVARDYPWKGAGLTARWKPDGRLLAAGMQDGSVHLWNVASGTESQMQGYGSKVIATEWSANGRYLATTASSSLIVWDFSGKGPEGSRPLELRSHSERVTALACRPTGSWLVSAALDRRLLLWRVGASDTPQDAHLLADECTLLRYSRSGDRLAAGDARGGLSIFDC